MIDDTRNIDYHIDPIVIHQKVVEYLLGDAKQITEFREWSSSEDYLLRYLTYHLFAIIEGIVISTKQKTDRDDIVKALLKQARQFNQILYQLARSKTFRKAQSERFPGDSRLILSSTERAISAAAIIDDAPAIAEFMITHAQDISQMKNESPLQTLRSRRDLVSAWNVADLYDVEICALWHFLLAWELKDQGDIESSRITLKRLSEKPLLMLTVSQQQILKVIIPKVLKVDEKTMLNLCRTLIGKSWDAVLFYTWCGNLDAAIQIAKNLTDDSANSRALAELAELQAASGDLEAALSTARSARVIDFHINQAKVRIAKLQAEAGEFDASLEIAYSIASDSVRSYALAEIAEVQGREDMDSAKSTLNAAIIAAKNITANNFVRSAVLSKIAESQSRFGMFDAAIRTVRSVPDAFYGSQALVKVAELQTKVDKDGAKSTLNAAIQTAKTGTTEFTRLETITEIAKLEARIDLNGAKSTFAYAIQIAKGVAEVANDWHSSDPFVLIAKSQAESGDFNAAIQTAKAITEDSDRAQAFAEIAELQARVDKDGAKSTFDNAIQITKGRADNLYWSQTLTRISQLQAESGDFQAARQTAENIAGYSSKSRALAKIAELQARVDKDGAMITLEAAIKTAKTVTDDSDKSESLARVAELQARVDKDGAKSTFEAALQTAKEIRSVYRRSVALGRISKLIVQVDKDSAKSTFEAALQTAKTITDDSDKSEALAEIATLQAESNELDAAIETTKLITDDSARSQALAKIAELQARADNDATRATLDAAVMTAKSLADDAHKLEILVEIAELQAELDKDSTKSTIEAALHAANSITDDYNRSNALVNIAKLQAESGYFDAALHTANSITDDFPRGRALGKISELQAKAGNFENAIDNSKTIVAYRKIQLYNVAKALIQAGDREQFKRILIPLAQDLHTSYPVVGLLFEVYRDQSKPLSETIRRLV